MAFEPARGWYELTAVKKLGPDWQVDHEQEWRSRALDERAARWHAETAVARRFAVVDTGALGKLTLRGDVLHRVTRRTQTVQARRWQQRGAFGLHGGVKVGQTRADVRWRGQFDALPQADDTWLTRVRLRVRHRLAGRFQVGGFAEGWQGVTGFDGRWQRLRVAALATADAGPVTFGVSHALQRETGDVAWAQLLRLACNLDLDKLMGGDDG